MFRRLKCFRKKRVAVFRHEARQNNELGSFREFTRTATTLALLLCVVGFVIASLQAVVPAAADDAPAGASNASGIAQLQRTAKGLALLPTVSAGSALAARVSHEGHWTFVNAAGETFTAASDGEVKRGFAILLPEAGARSTRVILTGDSVFERRGLLEQLPKTAERWLGWGDETFRLTMVGAGPAVRYLVELKSNLLIEVESEAAFAEAMRQLRRPIERQAFRVLSLEPGGPRTFSASPRVDRASGRASIDPIDPAYIMAALGKLSRQTAVLIGRFDGDGLIVKPPTGPERVLKWGELTAQAVAMDVDLLVLKSAAALQPGGRNWLWQQVEVKGLDTALGHATLADFFAALGSPANRLVLSVARLGGGRTTMDLRQLSGVPSAASTTETISGVLADAVAGLAGNVVHQGAVANFRSMDRQTELDRRLVPFVPSVVQWWFGGLWLLGLVGAPLAWRWWARAWPAEQAAEYPNAFGFWAARSVRGSIFVVLFLPLVAIVSAPLTIWTLMGRAAGRRTQAAVTKV